MKLLWKLRPIHVVLLSLLALIGLILALTTWETVQEPPTISDRAARNPWLAAQQFLQEFDTTTERHADLDLTLPSTNGTLLLANDLHSLGPERAARLHAWAQAGGRLVAVAGQELTDVTDDPLLGPLGLVLRSTGAATPRASERPLRAPPLSRDSPHCPDPAQAASFKTGESQWILAFGNERGLVDERGGRTVVAMSPAGAQMIETPVGAGSIVVLTSLDAWRNRTIACLDHAHTLRWLTGERASLHWIEYLALPSLTRLLWDRYAAAIVLAGCLLALWVWRQNVRETPPRPTTDQPRREVMEHVEGIARFLLQQNQLPLLLDPLRQQCQKVLKDSAMPEVAAALQVSQDDINHALHGDARSGMDLTEMVRLLQAIEQMRHAPPTRSPT